MADEDGDGDHAPRKHRRRCSSHRIKAKSLEPQTDADADDALLQELAPGDLLFEEALPEEEAAYEWVGEFVEEEQVEEYLGPKPRPSDLAMAADNWIDFPYGERYEPITPLTLKQIAYELGMIRLCWPEVEVIEFEGYTDFPSSYYTNTNKEKLVLLYAENFRRQFGYAYKCRKSLLLAADNELGVQKIVCSTIRNTIMPHREFSEWQGCAEFIADFLTYDPMEKPTLLPERLISPYMVLERRHGHCFEFATLLCSMLLGAGYDAFVASGYASREICLNMQDRVECPEKPNEEEVDEEVVEDTSNMKYLVKGRKDLRSQFLVKREQARLAKIAAAEKKKIDDIKAKQEIIELPPPDPLQGLRVHAWVVVLGRIDDVPEELVLTGDDRKKTEMDEEEEEESVVEDPAENRMETLKRRLTGKQSIKPPQDNDEEQEEEEDEASQQKKKKVLLPLFGDDAEEDEDEGEGEDFEAEYEGEEVARPEYPFFIEPSSGYRFEIDSPEYCGLESIWNEFNYWVNLQDCSMGLRYMSFDLKDTSLWEHLLPGEPIYMREFDDDDDPEPDIRNEDGEDVDVPVDNVALQEKHLDMPKSWVQQLNITAESFESRYPVGCKTVYYKKQILDKFAPYFRPDGMVKRLTIYSDMMWTKPTMQYEWYMYRADCLEYAITDINSGMRTEQFKRGREDSLKVHIRNTKDSDDIKDQELLLEFHHKAKVDGMSKLEIKPHFFKEHFVDQRDRLYFRDVTYAPIGSPPPGMTEGPRKIIVEITEKFNRNPDVPPSSDIATRIFLLPEREIKLIYHYEDNCATASTRDFIKPIVAKLETLTFNPELTSGYMSNPDIPLPKQLPLYYLLREQLETEEAVVQHVRDMEDAIQALVNLRVAENTEPKLLVGLFNANRNKEWQEMYLAKEQELRDMALREVESQVDMLGPNLAMNGVFNDSVEVTPALVEMLKHECLQDLKDTLLRRANIMQARYEALAQEIQDLREWFTQSGDAISPEEETQYFREIGALAFKVHIMEVRLQRHQRLSYVRYCELYRWLQNDPRLRLWAGEMYGECEGEEEEVADE